MAFVNIKKAKNGKLTFDIKEMDISIVNSLRRIIISEVPTVALAFDPLSDNNPDITITVNNTALHNEFLAHRLSLIPLKFDDKTISDFNPEEYIFKLKMKNTGTDTVNVTSNDIKIYNSKDIKYPDTFHEAIFPKDIVTKDYILINKLRPNIYNPDKGEEIDIVFKGSKNIGKLHSRWSPVSCCTLSNIVDEEEANIVLKQKLKDLAEQKGSPLSQKDIDTHTGRFNSLDKYRHFKKNKYGEANEFHFIIESECGLTPEYIFQQAFDILISKLDDFSVKLEVLQIKKVQDNQNFYEVIIPDEDYTLLNVLQCMTYNYEIRGNDQTQLEYIGYYQPHPLDNKMVLKIKFKTDTDVVSFIRTNIIKIVESLKESKDTWIKQTHIKK